MKTKETKGRGALKIKLKTYLCLFCTVAMTFSVAACGASNEESGDRANYLKSTEISSTSKDESAIVGSEAKKEEAADVQIKNEGKSKSDISFEEIIVVDNEECLIKITGIDPDNMWGYTVNFFLINKTDKNVMFSVDEASVNGYMADPFFAKEVMAGKCAFSSISWSDTTLENNNITAVEEIEFKLKVYDSDNWLDGVFCEETITLKP